MSENTAFLVYVFIPVLAALAIYWHFYVKFIERVRLKHPAIYTFLGNPTELDSELSMSNSKLWAFVLGFGFRSLGDRRLSFLGFGLIVTSFLAIGTGVICVAAWNASH